MFVFFIEAYTNNYTYIINFEIYKLKLIDLIVIYSNIAGPDEESNQVRKLINRKTRLSQLIRHH